jgi:hypothetical protein
MVEKAREDKRNVELTEAEMEIVTIRINKEVADICKEAAFNVRIKFATGDELVKL